MGTLTPNISIYIPAAGETNYDAAFASGMANVDSHDHSGGPNKGVPIASSGLAAGSVTFDKLATNVADNATGIGTAGSLGANQLSILGLLKNIYQLVTAAGFISKDGALAHARTLTGTANQITVTNGDGIGGDPVFSLPSLLSITTLRTGTFNTGGIAPAATTNVTGLIVSINQIYLVMCGIKIGGTGQCQISIVGTGNVLATNVFNGNTFAVPNPSFAVNTGTGQVEITNNDAGALDFQISWLRLL